MLSSIHVSTQDANHVGFTICDAARDNTAGCCPLTHGACVEDRTKACLQFVSGHARLEQGTLRSTPMEMTLNQAGDFN